MILTLLLTLLGTFSTAAAELVFELSTGARGQSVTLVSELSSWKADPYPHLSMQLSEVSPGRYRLALPAPWLPQVEYKFVVDGHWQHDPANQARVPDGHGGFNSVVRVAGFNEDGLLTRLPGVPAWLITSLEVRDWEGETREIVVALPPRELVLKTRKPIVAVYFHDGQDYLERAHVAELFANLSVRAEFPLFAAVFIAPKDRMREYDLSDDYAAFVARRVVSRIEKEFTIGGSPSRRLLIGASMGGLITAFTAIRHSDVFTQAASQSGSFWKDEGRIMPLLESSGGRRLKLFVDVGLYEHAQMVEFNRKARVALEQAGHDIKYREYPAGHDWIGWRNRLSEIMSYFFEAKGFKSTQR